MEDWRHTLRNWSVGRGERGATDCYRTCLTGEGGGCHVIYYCSTSESPGRLNCKLPQGRWDPLHARVAIAENVGHFTRWAFSRLSGPAANSLLLVFGSLRAWVCAGFSSLWSFPGMVDDANYLPTG